MVMVSIGVVEAERREQENAEARRLYGVGGFGQVAGESSDSDMLECADDEKGWMVARKAA